MIKAFPKIFGIGTDYIRDIFEGTVEITEKIDGSQFCFGRLDGEFYMRSKGKQIFPEAPEKMFLEAINYVMSMSHEIDNDCVYYAEYLKTPKHNVLNYERIPQNHLILFGMSYQGKFEGNHVLLMKEAMRLGIECVPLIHSGEITNIEDIYNLIERRSVLGAVKVEGIVVKNYAKPFLLGGQPIPIMMGKYVSEKYKEVHRKNWKGENTSVGKWQLFVESFRTEARWEKSVQHLRDNGELENSPRDIGKLLKEIPNDIIAEEKENIKEWLWKHFGRDILRRAGAGFPEWYKKKLLERSFENK